jgi:hypothetical protein
MVPWRSIVPRKRSGLASFIDMDRSIIAEHLELAERHVADGAQRIAEQQDRIRKLAFDGRDASEAIRLLRLFRVLQEAFVADRNRLLLELETATPQS